MAGHLRSLAVFFRREEKRNLLFICVSAMALAASILGARPFGADASWLAILLCGAPILKRAAVGLATKFDVKADLLVSIALIVSAATGEFFAAGEIAFIMAIGSYLEDRTVAKAREGIERLVRLTPTAARVVRGGEEAVIPACQVKAGDVLRVLAGETIVADGVISNGRTSVDQSVMTGESLPIDKEEGDEVQSGTVNQFGTFEMVAMKVGEDSSLQRMIRLMESADAGKAKIVGLADRWATWIVAIALASAAAAWFATGELVRSVTILVVFCPCALVLATPTALMAGIGNATRHGMLISRGDALERLAKAKRVAFDKTGTLTYGRPSVSMAESCAPDIDGSALLDIAAAAELRSEHPLGKAIVAHFRQERGRAPDSPDAFLLTPGRGVSAILRGREFCAGNGAFVADNGLTVPGRLAKTADGAREGGSTIIYVMEKSGSASGITSGFASGEAADAAAGGVADVASSLASGEAADSGEPPNAAGKARVIGMIALSDTVRPDAAQTVREIRRTGAGTVLLTGDAPQAAGHIAHIAGIADVRAGCMPEDKLAAIRQYQDCGEPVCMVGDGVNDAPALKAADVGIAMGGIGSDIAIEAADIVLVGDDITEIPHLLMLAKKVMRTINVNIAASMALNFAAIALAAAGVLNPVLGALVHNAGSVAVILNSSLLLKWRRKPADVKNAL